VTVEEIVDELELRPGGAVLPSWVVDAVAIAPGGAHPSYAHGYYERDNDFYVAWDAISRDRDRFREWMQRHVLDTADVREYHASLAAERTAA
jgi:glutaconate CoA-transferase, subunit A